MSEYFTLREEKHSLFGQGSKIKGELHLFGPTFISSFMEGDLIVEDNSDLSIETVGQFSGNIKCHNINIYGKFSGVLKSTGKVTVFPTAIVEGKVDADNFTIYPGATLNINGNTFNH